MGCNSSKNWINVWQKNREICKPVTANFYGDPAYSTGLLVQHSASKQVLKSSNMSFLSALSSGKTAQYEVSKAQSILFYFFESKRKLRTWAWGIAMSFHSKSMKARQLWPFWICASSHFGGKRNRKIKVSSKIHHVLNFV